MWSTIVSTAATGAIAVLAYFQWRRMGAHEKALNEMAERMREGLKETQKAASAAKDSAEAAIKSNVLTEESNHNAQAATDLTRRSLILSNPPKLSVRGVHLDAGLRADRLADGGLTIVNRGKTEAVIEKLYIDAIWGIPAKPLAYEQLAKTVHIVLDPGGETGAEQFYVFFFAVYKYGTEPAITKRILLCYKLRRSTGRFQTMMHPDLHGASEQTA
jgi:hypothetical protein